MAKQKITYYLATTGTIHLVAEMPSPRHLFRTQCGQIEIGKYKTMKVGPAFIKKYPEAHVCLRCKQLVGIK
jgi:hypothetical protein